MGRECYRSCIAKPEMTVGKSWVRIVVWMAAGAAVPLVFMLAILHYEAKENPAAQLAAKTQRLDLVARMQLNLAAASEAEKSAVLAVTDEDSQKFADQARAAAAEVEKDRAALAQRLAESGPPAEEDLLGQFTQAFAEFQQVDRDLLALAVQNSNVKAFHLAFGPATAALEEMDAALARLPGDDAKLVQARDNARIAAWHLLALLPPHIAEEDNAKMDQMEARMEVEDRAVHAGLDQLGALPALAGNADLKAAVDGYARFNELKRRVLKLSRENTNVRSLSISLNEKRKVTLTCQATLAALQQAIQAEPIRGLGGGKVRPR